MDEFLVNSCSLGRVERAWIDRHCLMENENERTWVSLRMVSKSVKVQHIVHSSISRIGRSKSFARRLSSWPFSVTRHGPSHTWSVCNLGSSDMRLVTAIEGMMRAMPDEVTSCVARRSNNLISRLNMSLVASWSDLHRDNAPVKLFVLLFTTAAARLMVSSEMCKWVGVGDRLSEPHDPHELVSLSSRVGRRLILGECDVTDRRPITWPEMCSHMRLNRRTGPVNKGLY